MKTITYDDTLYQLVPKEATHEMCLAAHDGPNCGAEHHMQASDRAYWEDCYLALISAAPTPPAQPIMRICFVRFGRKDGVMPLIERSKNCLTDELECGISVYEALERDGKYQILLPRLDGTAPATLGQCYNVAQGLWGMENTPLFEVDGEVVGFGGDGEPLLKNCKVVKRIFQFPTEIQSGHIADAITNGFIPPAQPTQELDAEKIELLQNAKRLIENVIGGPAQPKQPPGFHNCTFSNEPVQTTVVIAGESAHTSAHPAEESAFPSQKLGESNSRELLSWIRYFIHRDVEGPGVVIRDAKGEDIRSWLDDVDAVLGKPEPAALPESLWCSILDAGLTLHKEGDEWWIGKAQPAERMPLTEKQTDDIWDQFQEAPTRSFRYLVTQAIETAHGIKE